MISEKQRQRRREWRRQYALGSLRIGRFDVDLVAVRAWRLHRPRPLGESGYRYTQIGPMLVWWQEPTP